MKGECDSTRARNYASYMVKTFGATRESCQFYRLPKVIQRAKESVPSEDIVGFLAFWLSGLRAGAGAADDRAHLL